jgi:hypothetical protein
MPRRARLTTYMTVGELVSLLGLPPSRRHRQRLRRHLEARQRSTGENILHRLSDSPNSPVVFTLASLREHCPELFDRREEALEIIREEVHAMQQQILELKQRDGALAGKLRELQSDLRSRT